MFASLDRAWSKVNKNEVTISPDSFAHQIWFKWWNITLKSTAFSKHWQMLCAQSGMGKNVFFLDWFNHIWCETFRWFFFSRQYTCQTKNCYTAATLTKNWLCQLSNQQVYQFNAKNNCDSVTKLHVTIPICAKQSEICETEYSLNLCDYHMWNVVTPQYILFASKFLLFVLTHSHWYGLWCVSVGSCIINKSAYLNSTILSR